MTYPATGILDDFNRANEDPATGWTDRDGTGVEIISNQLGQDSASSGGYWTTAMTGPDVEIWATIGVKPGDTNEIYLRVRDDPGVSEGYSVRFGANAGTDDFQLRDPAGNLIGSASQELGANDRFLLRASGSTISVAYSVAGGTWVEAISVTDADEDGAPPNDHLSVGLGDSIGTRLDNVGGGVLWVAESADDDTIRTAQGRRW